MVPRIGSQLFSKSLVQVTRWWTFPFELRCGAGGDFFCKASSSTQRCVCHTWKAFSGLYVVFLALRIVPGSSLCSRELVDQLSFSSACHAFLIIAHSYLVPAAASTAGNSYDLVLLVNQLGALDKRAGVCMETDNNIPAYGKLVHVVATASVIIAYCFRYNWCYTNF